MTTPLEKTLKRELSIKGRAFIVAISPDGLKLTLKGRRKGFELSWDQLISGDAALAIALNASVGQFPVSDPSPKNNNTKAPKARQSRPRKRREAE